MAMERYRTSTDGDGIPARTANQASGSRVIACDVRASASLASTSDGRPEGGRERQAS
jgi:hypothetical protein